MYENSCTFAASKIDKNGFTNKLKPCKNENY